jgi:hypothetical protein
MGSGWNWTWPAYYGCKHCLEISESFTGDNGFYADRKFKMVDSEGALHMVSKQTLTSAGNDFEFPMGSKSNKTCQGP